MTFVLDEEPELEDDLDYFESAEHAELEAALFEAAGGPARAALVERARAAQAAGRLSRAALAQLLETAVIG